MRSVVYLHIIDGLLNLISPNLSSRRGGEGDMRQLSVYNMPQLPRGRHVGRDCRHPEPMDVLVSLAVHGVWIPAIPAGMTPLSLSWRLWG